MAPTRTLRLKASSLQEVSPRFPCPRCDQTFMRKNDVKRHVKSIHDRIRYYCSEPGCSFNAGQSAALVTHMNKHTGHKPHVCPKCPAAYGDPSSLNHHKQKKHGHIPHHTPAWHEQQSRKKKNARASPYDVSAPAVQGTVRAKMAAATSDATSSSASSGYSSLPSLSSDFSAPTLPQVSPSSDSSDFSPILASALSYHSSLSSSSSAGSEFSPPTPVVSSTFDTSDFFSSSTSSVAFTDFHGLKKEASAFDLSGSDPGYAAQDLAMTQCPHLVQDPTYGYNHAAQPESADYCGLQTPALLMQDYTSYLDDVNSQVSYDAAVFNPAWAFADDLALWDQQPQCFLSQPLYPDTAVFQPTPDFYDGAIPQQTSYALPPPSAQLGAIPTHQQYAPPVGEQPAPASMFTGLGPVVNDTVEQMTLWAKLNMTQRQQLAPLAF